MNVLFSTVVAPASSAPTRRRRLGALACLAATLCVANAAAAQPAAAQPEPPPAADAADAPDEPADASPEPAETPDSPAATEPAPAPAPASAPATDPSAAAMAKPNPADATVAAGAPAPAVEPESDAPRGRSWWREKAVLELGEVRLAPVVLLSSQLAVYAGDDSFFQSGDAAERVGFRLRNVRFGFDGSYDNKVRLRVTTEIGSDTDAELRVHDAWFGYTPLPEFSVFAGAQRTPFGRFAQVSTGQTALIQRPLGTSALSPGHQIGITAQGSVANGMFQYAAGIFNGLQRGLTFYEGYERNYAPFGNRFDGMSVVARVATSPLGPLLNSGADEDKGDARLGVGANYLFSDGGNRDLHSAGGDAHLQVAGFHAMTEFLWGLSLPATQPTQPDAPTAEVTSLTFAGEVGYVIIENMLNVAARFEWIDPDTLSDDESDNWLLTAGGGVYLVDQLLRAQVEYTHREEMNGRSLANDTVVLQLQVQLDPGSAAPGRRGSAPAAARLQTPAMMLGAL